MADCTLRPTCDPIKGRFGARRLTHINNAKGRNLRHNALPNCPRQRQTANGTWNSQHGTCHLAALVYIFYKPLTRRSPGNNAGTKWTK